MSPWDTLRTPGGVGGPEIQEARGRKVVAREVTVTEAVGARRPAIDGKASTRGERTAAHRTPVDHVVDVRPVGPARAAHVAEVAALSDPLAHRDERGVAHVRGAVVVALAAACIPAFRHDLIAVARAGIHADDPTARDRLEQVTLVARIPVRGIGVVAGVVAAAVTTGHPHVAAALEGQAPAPGEGIVGVRRRAVHDVVADVVLRDEARDVLGQLHVELEHLAGLLAHEAQGELVGLVLLDEAPLHLRLVVDDGVGKEVRVDDEIHVHAILHGDLRCFLEGEHGRLHDDLVVALGLHDLARGIDPFLPNGVVEPILVLRAAREELHAEDEEEREHLLDGRHVLLAPYLRCEGASRLLRSRV